MNREIFLQEYPWDPKLLAGKQPIDCLWTFPLDASAESLWPYLIDSSSFNKRIGLPPMNYREVDGKLLGFAKYNGIETEWEEVPWEWEYCSRISSARIYSKGLATYVRFQMIIEKLDFGRTQVWVYFGWVPRHWWGRKLLRVAMGQMEGQFAKAYREIVSEIHHLEAQDSATEHKPEHTGEPTPGSPPPPTPTTASDPRIREFRTQLLEKGFSEQTLDGFLSYILQGDENELARIRVKKLAPRLGMPLPELLSLCLHSCRIGLLTLTWDMICPHCRGTRTELQHLGDIPQSGSCAACDVDFLTNQFNSIEITFHVHPSIREIQKRFYCAAEPAQKPHILYQKLLQPQEFYSAVLSLQPGSYRLRAGSDKKYTQLEINPATENPSDEGEELRLIPGDFPESLTVANEVKVQIQNPDDHPITFVVESRQEDQDCLRPGDLFSFPEFRDLFSEEAIAQGITLDIGVQTILFTDIVGSTALYAKLGDSSAFARIRKHFQTIYESVQSRQGIVVKTIGDSVMASFSDPHNAILTAEGLQTLFQSNTEQYLSIRITVHSGPCLAVNFNSGIDYFGNTVNYAAKLQKYADAGDIVFSDSFFRQHSVKTHLQNQNYKLYKIQFQPKWEPGTQRLAYKVHVG